LWSDQHRFFVDYDVDGQEQSPVLASSGFLPLICGAASEEQARHLAAHLEDPGMFGTPFPVPSIAMRDAKHYSKDMWRGPTWININWLIARGLDRYGMHDAARELRERTVAGVETYCERFGVPFEFYDDRDEVAPPELLRKGKCAPRESPYHQVFHDYGWTATLYADMVYSRAE
jgi:neutral trehalase